MWKILICDDEQECRNSVLEMLARYEKESGNSLEVSAVQSGEELMKRFSPEYDLLLLDIQMKTLSGMNAARAIRQKGSDVPIIFITAMTEYAIEGYEVHAFGFLKKPVHYRQLAWQLDDVFAMLEKKQGINVLVQDGDTVRAYKSSEIAWAEVLGHDVQLHITDGSVQRCTTPLAKLQEQLSASGFFRAHKSFLVNMQHVRSVNIASITMRDGAEVPLSKHRKQDFLYAFAESRGIT